MLCPIDESPLDELQCGTALYCACPLCHGVWIPAATAKALLSGEAALSRDVLRAATPAWASVAVEPSAVARAPELAAHRGSRELPRRYHCAECGAVLRMRDKTTNASPCTRCGAVWIERGGEPAIGAWYRHAMQAGAMAIFAGSHTTISRSRHDDEDTQARQVMVLLVASFAAFVIFAPANGRAPAVVRHLPSFALGAVGAALIVRGFKHPSRYQLGALTRKGFAVALGGVALVIAAIFAWR
jgi:Zn-finger nucleic acid-binding protein